MFQNKRYVLAITVQHTQCANRPCCVTVMRILSANDIDVAVVSMFLMLNEADFERAGNGAWFTA